MDEQARARVQVARDAIMQIEAEGVVVKDANAYVMFRNASVSVRSQPLKQLIDVIAEAPTGVCEVCAKGALLIGYLSGNGKMTVEQAARDFLSDVSPPSYMYAMEEWNVSEKLSEVFSKEQLDTMEWYFEHTDKKRGEALRDPYIVADPIGAVVAGPTGTVNGAQYAKLVNPFGKLPAKERLVAILNNIIANEGEFIPPCSLAK